MPFLRFELDALALVPKVARSAEVPEGVIAWGLLQMWEWCWREKTTRVTPTQLRGFFGCEPSEALRAFGFIHMTLPERDFFVRGAEKHLRVSAARAAGGHAAKRHLVPGGKKTASAEQLSGQMPSGCPAPAQEPARQPLGSTASSQQPTALEERTYVSEAPAAPDGQPPAAPMPGKAPGAPVAAKAPHVPNVPAAPTTPREGWLFPDFWGWAQHKRHQAGLVPEPPPNMSKGSSWWSTARSVASTDELCAGFLDFGDDPYWQGKRPALPFAGFMSQWHRFVTVREENHAPQG